jgi:two-component system NtrC family sensor kinase
VTSRWRIRHKLLLGLGLVVGLMALLLVGTLRGLWSYYLTTNSIRARLAELEAAEELKSTVASLIAPDNTAKLLKLPSEDIEPEFKKVGDAITLYEERLDDTLSHARGANQGTWETEQVDLLRREMAAYQQALVKYAHANSAGAHGDSEQEARDRKALAPPAEALRRAALDLRDHLKKELGIALAETRSHYQTTLWIVVPSSVVGLLVMFGLMRSFYVWVLGPVRDLEAGVGRVAKGDLNHRIELHSGDEMEDLARAFNGMLAQLQALYSDLAGQVNERSRQLVRSERLASVGFLAAGVAHEINNPLASIAFCSEALEARLMELLRPLKGRGVEEHEVFRKYLKMIQEEAFRCKSITERLLEFSRTGEPRREAADLRELVQAVLDVTRHLPNHRGKHITFEVPPERGGRVTAWVNPEEIKSVILNLVVNALESMEEGGRLTVRLAAREDGAELTFRDTGCGMTREVLDNIFEPFYTRSRSGKGTGLGLTITHLIISQHGGEIAAGSAGPGQGSTFVVRLPGQPREPAVELTIGGVPAAAAPLLRAA